MALVKDGQHVRVPLPFVREAAFRVLVAFELVLETLLYYLGLHSFGGPLGFLIIEFSLALALLGSDPSEITLIVLRVLIELIVVVVLAPYLILQLSDLTFSCVQLVLKRLFLCMSAFVRQDLIVGQPTRSLEGFDMVL